jgi:hypothetical protein
MGVAKLVWPDTSTRNCNQTLQSAVLQGPSVRGGEDEDGGTHDDREVHLGSPVTVKPQRQGDERAAWEQQLDQQVRARGAGGLEERLQHGAIFGGL